MYYYVYVIRLDDAVIRFRKFQRQNPQMKPRFPCFYVGQSSHPPETRFWQHKNGYKSNRFVQEFGLGLCPQFYEAFNPIPTRKEAERVEIMVTQNLRVKGYGVWSN